MTTISFKSGIYKIENEVNGRVYYGSSIDLKRRKREHFNALKKRKHSNPFLQNDFNKYGDGVFAFHITKFCSPENLLVQEQRYLDEFWDQKTKCYNIKKTAEMSSEEVRNKLSKANFGNGNPMFGNRGRLNKNSRKIFQFDKRGNLLAVHFGCNEAATKTHGNPSAINLCCNGKLKTSGGFIWSYNESVEPEKTVRPKRNKRILVSPSGEHFEFTNLRKFCEDHSLKYSSILAVMCGSRTSCHGWRKEK